MYTETNHYESEQAEARVTPTVVGGVRLYRTEDGRLLSQQQLDARPDRFALAREIRASARLALSN